MDPDVDADFNFYNDAGQHSSQFLDMEQVTSSISLPYKDDFSFIHVTCKRLFYKLSDIHLLVAQTDATVVAVSETSLDCDLCCLVWFFQDTALQPDVDEGSRGEGAGFYVKDNVSYEEFEADWKRGLHNTFESMFIKLIQDERKNITAGVVYRPLGHSVDDFNTGIDCMLSKMNGNILLAGNFNIDLLKN